MRTLLERARWCCAVLLAAALLAPPVRADGLGVVVQRIDAAQFPNVRAFVSVASANGIPVTGLDQKAFQVQEDGKPVEGLAVDPVIDSQEPILTALVIDVSGSMNDEHKLERAKDAATSFIDALGPADRVTLVSFANQVNVVQDYTPDKSVLKSAIAGLTAQGNTQLYDAITQAARRQANQPERRRPVIVLTDGDDTASSASPDTAIAAATAAGSVVFAIGLGSEVNKAVLGQIASGTGGQSIFVSDPAELKATLLSINDLLRRQYVLRYSSKLTADTQPHGLAVQASYAGQQSTGLRSFTIPMPPAVTVTGLTTAFPVSGIQHVTVDVTGATQSIELLVDDRIVGTARSSPAAFDWDLAREGPGQRRVVVRVRDIQGGTVEKPFSVVVAAPAPPPTPVPATAVSTPVFVPTTGPVVISAPEQAPAQNVTGIDSGLLVGILLLLFLVVATVWYLSRGPRLRLPAVSVPSGTVGTQIRGDQTEIVDGAAVRGGLTFMRPGSNKPAPQVHLRIVRHGQKTDFETRDSPITLGRARDRATVMIDDPLVSGEHARIRRDGVQFSIEDLRSKNGTRINGEPIVPETRRALKSNDQIYMGDTVVTFVVDSR